MPPPGRVARQHAPIKRRGIEPRKTPSVRLTHAVAGCRVPGEMLGVMTRRLPAPVA